MLVPLVSESEGVAMKFKCGWRCTVCDETRYYDVEIDAVDDGKGGTDVENTLKVRDGSLSIRFERDRDAREHIDRKPSCRAGIHIFGLHEDPVAREERLAQCKR